MKPLELNNSDLDRSKNHISNVSNNMVNVNENRVSALSISYISYFYHVFPLHLNSFNLLFSDVISPKLSILISSVNTFICLTCDIKTLVPSLEDVSKFLTNNPAQELLNIINRFDGQSYVNEVKSNLEQLIDKLKSKLKYDDIISHINSIVKTYNKNLNKWFVNFKTKIKEHKSDLEENIKNYIKKIKDELDKHSSCAQNLLKSISNAIENLNTNKDKLSQFDDYTSYGKIAQSCARFETSEKEKLEEIVKTHEKYKKCLKFCREITSRLKELKDHLEEIKNCAGTLTSKLNILSSELPSTTNIDEALRSLKEFKTKLEYNKYEDSLQKLEKIGGYITTMKDNLNQVKDKVQDKVKPGVINYIEGLCDITINPSDVKQNIEEIKGTNESVNKKLEIVKSASKFYKLLEGEVGKLTLTFYYHHDVEFLKIELLTVKHKLTTFQSNIDSTLNSTKEAIQKAEEEIKELKKECQETQGQASEDNKLILCKLNEIQEYYTENIEKIKTLKGQFLNEITTINDLLSFLENNKNQSADQIGKIKSEVSGITKLNHAITTLPKAVKKLTEFVKLQNDTKVLIDNSSKYPKLSSLSRYTKPLEQIITDSKKLIGQSNYYIGYLKITGHVDSLVTCIKSCYESKIHIIKQIFENFKDYVKEITTNLCTITCDLLELKSIISTCCPGYTNNNSRNGDNSCTIKNRDSSCNENGNSNRCNNTNQGNVSGSYDLYKLKDYMNNLKFYFTKIKTNFTTIQVLLERIKQESSYIDTNKAKLENLKCVIDFYIGWFEICKMSIYTKYLKSLKDKIIEILEVKHMIMNCIDMKKIGNIESNLNDIDKKIMELECAIEGVARNMIRCSLKSLSNNLKNHTGSNQTQMIQNDPIMINYSILNVTKYNAVINKLYELSIKIDQIFQLIRLTRECECIISLERSINKRIILGTIYFHNIMDTLSKSKEQFKKSLKLDRIKKINDLERSTNHFCLCIINKYILYPAIFKLFYIFFVDLEMLSTKSRKYEKYMNSTCFISDIGSFFIIAMELLNKVYKYIMSKLKNSSNGSSGVVKNICFCVYSSNPYYNMFVTIILWVSTIIENIWSMNIHSIGIVIQCLSSLLAQFDITPDNINFRKNLKTIIASIYKPIIVNQIDLKNKSSFLYSGELSFNYHKIIINNINTDFKWLTLITKINSLDRLKVVYQIFSTLIFELNINGADTKIKINRSRTMYIAKLYISMLRQKPTNRFNGWCKCGKEKIYLLIILMTNSYIKLALRINIQEDLLYIMDLVKKNMFKEFMEIIKWVNYMNKETINDIEIILRITKNNYSTHFNTYTDHKNIANSFPGLTIGYGYENV